MLSTGFFIILHQWVPSTLTPEFAGLLGPCICHVSLLSEDERLLLAERQSIEKGKVSDTPPKIWSTMDTISPVPNYTKKNKKKWREVKIDQTTFWTNVASYIGVENPDKTLRTLSTRFPVSILYLSFGNPDFRCRYQGRQEFWQLALG